jgi:hypothetical protein
VIRETGYDPEAIGRIRGALATKLSGLRLGYKGRMLDTAGSTPAALLFDSRVVIEMESLGDEQDKAFLMGLMLIRLAEHRRHQRPFEKLRHLLVVEEAHRLLTHGSQGQQRDFDDASGKAIETFINLLAEVRAYGQGVIIADQVPARLAPEVLKLTNLKIVHRLVAEDDRHAVSATMGMDDKQSRALVTLTPGQAVVFTEGEDAPLLVAVQKPAAAANDVGPQQPRGHAREAVGAPPRECCGQAGDATCDLARSQAGDARLRSLIAAVALTAAASPSSAPFLFDDLRIQFNRVLPGALSENSAQAGWRCLVWRNARYLARRRAAQRGWSYPDMAAYQEGVYKVFLALGDDNAASAMDAAIRLQALSQRLFHRDVDPFPACARICPDRSCLFRWPVADEMAEPTVAAGLQAILALPWDQARPQVKAQAEVLAKHVIAGPWASWDDRAVVAATWQASDAAANCAGQLAIATQSPVGTGGLRDYIDALLAPTAAEVLLVAKEPGADA